ncbi:hypothetical protein [Helicobacter sp.]|nr:hypothetical protein [Helicobacter sp.]
MKALFDYECFNHCVFSNVGSLGGYDEAVKIVAEIKPKTLAQL